MTAESENSRVVSVVERVSVTADVSLLTAFQIGGGWRDALSPTQTIESTFDALYLSSLRKRGSYVQQIEGLRVWVRASRHSASKTRVNALMALARDDSKKLQAQT